MAFQITNITDEPSQRHILLSGDEEITLILNFYEVTQMWSFDVSWREVRYNGFMISLGCLHIQSLNWPFDFFCVTTDSSGMAPFRLGDFSDGRCELYFASREEIEADRAGQLFPFQSQAIPYIFPEWIIAPDFFLNRGLFDIATNVERP